MDNLSLRWRDYKYIHIVCREPGMIQQNHRCAAHYQQFYRLLTPIANVPNCVNA
jgi:hypothetical protein